MLLKDLKTEYIQQLYNSKLSTGRLDGGGGLSARTVKYMHIVLHEALKQAVKNELIVKNVTDPCVLPKREKKDIHVLSLEEQRALIKVLDGERMSAAIMLAMATGIREGELLALQWSDIDLENCKISITKTIKRIKNFETKKTELHFHKPKTKASERIVPFPQSLKSILIEHKNRQKEEISESGDCYNTSDLVFCTISGNPLEPVGLIRIFERNVKKAGIKKINFHALRHTFATRLLEANEHPKVVQEILGHSDVGTTLNTYSHVLHEVKNSAVEKIDHLFK